MKLYLFGGAETDKNEAPALKVLINEVISDLKPKQLLHVPYCRINVPSEEQTIWGEGWVKNGLNLGNCRLLDARNKQDLEEANNPLIFINGGPDIDNLFEKITSDKQLFDLVNNAENIIGESSGAAILASFRPTYEDNPPYTKKGLGILKQAIIEPHYSQQNRKHALINEMKESGVRYGIGIDTLTGIVIDPSSFPKDYTVIGKGLVELIES